jgi:D-alanyl-D-alanine dipeptidase
VAGLSEPEHGKLVLIADPEVTRIPIVDCGDALVDARPWVMVDERRRDRQGLHGYMRRGLLRRLLTAQRLLPDGWQFLVIEAYRRPQMQRRLFERYAEQQAAANPYASREEIDRLASRWVAPVDFAPHVAGAALDLTLWAGCEIDMGSDEGATPEESGGRCYFDAVGLITREARRNRAILAFALSSAGFVNYPTEWWHWSYGDRYWAFQTNATVAHYGPVDDASVT